MSDLIFNLSENERMRFARHIQLMQVGEEGQTKLKNATVLIVGVGGLGCPVALYLAASGVGHIVLVDPDRVEISNLQRQILFNEEEKEKPKVEVAAERLQKLYPELSVITVEEKFTAENGSGLLEDVDIVVDGSDNFPTRYLTNDLAYWAKKPLVYGAIYRFEGQATVFGAHEESPCYRCLFPAPPKPGLVPT